MRGQVTETSHNDSHSRLWMTVGRSMSAMSASMTWCSEWTPRLEKFSENALWASSSRNRRERGAKLEDEEAPEWRGFRAGVDLHLDVIDTTNVNRKRGRERKDNQKSSKQLKYNKYIEKRVCMHGKCMNIWHAKQIALWAQPNPNLWTHKQIAFI